MNLADKLKSVAFTGLLSAVAISNTGCEELNQAINNGALTGFIAKGAAASYAEQGNIGAANAMNVYGDIQNAEYQRRTAIEAAEASRSTINVNLNQNPEPMIVINEVRELPKDNEKYFVQDKSYSFAFLNWIDWDGDKCVSLNEFGGVGGEYSLSKTYKINFMTRVDPKFKCFYPRIHIIEENEKNSAYADGQAISGDLAIVSVLSSYLEENNISGDYRIFFQLLDPQKRIYQREPIVDYKITFAP